MRGGRYAPRRDPRPRLEGQATPAPHARPHRVDRVPDHGGRVIRRLAALAVLLSGIGLALWLGFGAPQDWHGGMRLLRMGMGLTAIGMITASSWLMFPDRTDDGRTDTGAPERISTP